MREKTKVDMQLNNQHKILLAILDCLGEVYGKTRLQKIVFITQKEIFGQDEFVFEPAQFGPFSRGVSSAVNELINFDFVNSRIETNHENPYIIYYLSEKGKQAINQQNYAIFNENEEEKVRKFGYKSYQDIMRYVHSNYEQFLINKVEAN